MKRFEGINSLKIVEKQNIASYKINEVFSFVVLSCQLLLSFSVDDSCMSFAARC